MRRALWFSAFLACCLLIAAGTPRAQLAQTGAGLGTPAPVTYSGPGDVVSGAKFWYGLRCYNTAYSGNVADIWDGSTGSTTETLLTCSAGGTINQTINTLATTCSVSCRVKTLYDQSGQTLCSGGVACTLSQATNANRPPIVLNCLGSKSCISCVASSSTQMTSATLTSSISQPTTFSGVVLSPTFASGGNFYSVTGGSSTPATVGEFSANTFQIDNGTALNVSATDSTTHAVQAIYNGASSNGVIDSTSNTGNAGAGTTLLGPVILCNDQFNDFSTVKVFEFGLWGSAFNSTQYGNMNSNQHSYWGF